METVRFLDKFTEYEEKIKYILRDVQIYCRFYLSFPISE